MKYIPLLQILIDPRFMITSTIQSDKTPMFGMHRAVGFTDETETNKECGGSE